MLVSGGGYNPTTTTPITTTTTNPLLILLPLYHLHYHCYYNFLYYYYQYHDYYYLHCTTISVSHNIYFILSCHNFVVTGMTNWQIYCCPTPIPGTGLCLAIFQLGTSSMERMRWWSKKFWTNNSLSLSLSHLCFRPFTNRDTVTDRDTTADTVPGVRLVDTVPVVRPADTVPGYGRSTPYQAYGRPTPYHV